MGAHFKLTKALCVSSQLPDWTQWPMTSVYPSTGRNHPDHQRIETCLHHRLPARKYSNLWGSCTCQRPVESERAWPQGPSEDTRTMYSASKHLEQSKHPICWLKDTPRRNFVMKPFLWGFSNKNALWRKKHTTCLDLPTTMPLFDRTDSG